jgi:DNA-binding NarL/FixJ family response regulator
MSELQRVTVLLADSDLLRRDGVAAVLKASPEVEVIAGCEDGPRALDEIRNLRPDIAIVDLNLPVLHGIELVRRIRGEHLTTKVILVSGTQEDDIVREAIRAGADAYLLKNGPARHLTDAISYVRDGGQYFSPQLGRDGRDRHLLEEPRRTSTEARRDSDPDREADAYHERENRLPERRARPRTADPARFRERIREESSRDLRDSDYEIMSQMADRIRPILDRLDDIESRVIEMEDGAEPVPADPRGWLNQQLARTVDDSRPPSETFGTGAPRDMERMIEEAVTRRFQTMAGKLQEQIEEQHIRTIETFVKNIQVKLVQRVSVLEQNVSQQAHAMHQLREYNQRTEDNLNRLISGVDKLAQELPKRLAAASLATEASGRRMIEAPATAPQEPEHKKRRSSTGLLNDAGRKAFWVVALLAVAGWGGYRLYSRHAASAPTAATAGKTATVSGGASMQKTLAKPSSSADTKTKLEAAREYADRKEYATAEDIYKQVLQAEPNNADAIKALASVLYREDKLDESAAMLDRLPKN